MTLNKSRQQLPSTWDKAFGPDDKRCLQVTGLKIKYVGQYCLALAKVRLVKVADFSNFCILVSVNFTSGPGDNDKDAASVRADHPVPFDVSLYYYEVQVVNKGRDGFVGIANFEVCIASALLSSAGPAEQAAWIGSLLTS